MPFAQGKTEELKKEAEESIVGDVNKENNSPPKRRSARLAKTPVSYADNENSAEEPEPQKLPFVKYKGAIKYFIEHNEIAESSDFLMQWVEKQTHLDKVPLSFDVEWPFSFQTGPGKSSVIQICADESCCYVFHLSKLKKLPAALVALMKHPKVRLHGVNVKNDFRKLSRDFPELNADVLIENCVDLGVWCNEVCETGGRWSLDRLSGFICRMSVDKNKKVRMSKWHVVPLDENQLMYAATDVYIGHLIYRELEKREQIKKKNEENFKLKNGEEAFKAVKGLGETFLGPGHEIGV